MTLPSSLKAFELTEEGRQLGNTETWDNAWVAEMYSYAIMSTTTTCRPRSVIWCGLGVYNNPHPSK
jgi:hypothetical protein